MHDLMGKFVELRLSVRRNPDPKSLGDPALLPSTNGALVAYAEKEISAVESLYYRGGVVATPSANAAPGILPKDSGTRGTWTGILLAQFLQSPCRPPTKPPANPQQLGIEDVAVNQVGLQSAAPTSL